MNWMTSFFVALLTGIAGLFLSGFCASLVVDWYRISSFEGGSGYFVVMFAMLGGVLAFIVGIVISRSAMAGIPPTFFRAFGTALTFVLIGNGAVAGVSRYLADIPPQIDGEELLLHFELQWPASERSDPRTLVGVPRAELGVTTAGSVRKQDISAFLLEDARLEAGRWIAPGAAHLFTSRGKPLLMVFVGDSSLGGFLLPLASHPSARDHEWSEWMPRPRPGAAPLPDGFRVRYRVIKVSEPLRTQTVGPFTVTTVARDFSYSGEKLPASARSTFKIAFNGKAVEGMEELTDVSVVGGDVPALLATGGHWNGNESQCVLLSAKGDTLSVQNGGVCQSNIEPRLLTNDPKLFAERARTYDVRGWLDRAKVATPGLYKLDNAILDTRSLTLTPFAYGENNYPPDPPGILAVSPDERSVVWYQMDPPALGVTDYLAKQSYTLPIDHERMRYGGYDHLDPGWVDHHFAWVRDAAGHDSLVVRKDFTPLPYHGDVTLAKPGAYQSWTIAPGSEALRDLIFKILTTRLGGELLPESPTTVTRTVRIDGKAAEVFLNDSTYVSVSLSDKSGDPELMKRIAAALDAELATGKYDALFVRHDVKEDAEK